MQNIKILFLLPAVILACQSGSSDKEEETTGPGTESVQLDASDFTYSLSQSTDALQLWTTPCTHKVTIGDIPPETQNSGLKLAAAKREFEPVQLVFGPGSRTVNISIDQFPNLGAKQRIETAVASFESGFAEQLTPLGADGAINLTSHNVPLWITFYIPVDAPAGEHTTTLHITDNGTDVEVPITLTVFDFELPAAVNFASQLNINVSDRIPEGGSVDQAKTMLFEHRFTPKSVTWPSGFNWSITWENDHSTDTCEILWDEPDEPEQYSIGRLSKRYILGEDWNGVGFPNAMIFQFVDNSTPRPGEFCGISRGDHLGTSEYNAEWSQFLGSCENYLTENGMIEKAYYYVQNEPQNEEDHKLAAHLCRLTREAAPNLRIAISEEPKPEIAEESGGACGYDIWIAHVRSYQQTYAWERQRDHGEAVWLYSLDHDPDPYFNPTRIDVQGVHQRIIPWVSWHERATGWAYYDANRFFSGPHPTIRAELLREGFEDYEYLYLANGGAHPIVFEENPVDATVDSMASGLTSWSKDPDAMMALRLELGRYLEGSRDTLPVLESDSDVRPKAAYYLNFQDPQGNPTTEPLVDDGNTYLKIGWSEYNDEDGFGWYGEHVTDNGIALAGYDSVDGYSEIQRSYVYDDYGRDNLFEFAIENGLYEVTIGVGRPSRGYPNDPYNASIEGIKVVDDEITTDDAPLMERSVTVDIKDGSLSVVTGGRSETTNEWSYTFLGYLRIVPVE